VVRGNEVMADKKVNGMGLLKRVVETAGICSAVVNAWMSHVHVCV